MKTIYALAIATLMALNSCTTTATTAQNTQTEADYWENAPAFSGMCFCTESVTEEYEYDNAYCVLYSDPDANMCEVEICLTAQSYAEVCEAIKTDNHTFGTLEQEGEIEGVPVFRIVWEQDEETEINTCSYAREMVVSIDKLTY